MKKIRTSSLPISPGMEILQDRFPRKRVFVTNQPAGFGIADRGAKRGSGLVYTLSDNMPLRETKQVLSALEVFFNGGIEEKDVGSNDLMIWAIAVVDAIITTTDLDVVTENYLGFSVVFGRYRVGRRTNVFDLTMPSKATHIAINASWLPGYAPRTPVTEEGIINLPYWRRTSDAVEPADFYVWPIGGVYRSRPSRVVSDWSAEMTMRDMGEEFYRYLSVE